MALSEDDITCIVSTSPTKMSAEDQLDMIHHTVRSIRQHVGVRVPLVVVCDNHKAPQGEDTRQDKRGRVGAGVAAEYARFKQLLAAESTLGTVLELQRHCGFGHAIGIAMERCATTSHVLVVQHDFMFNDPVRLDVVAAALSSGVFRYVVFPCGQKMVKMALHTNRPHENRPFRPDGICVLPFHAYHDKNHVIAREVYLREVLPHVRLGQFPEDVLNQRMAARNPDWHRDFGIGLYYDPRQPRGAITHLRGRQSTHGDFMRMRVRKALRSLPADTQDGEAQRLALPTAECGASMC